MGGRDQAGAPRRSAAGRHVPRRREPRVRYGHPARVLGDSVRLPVRVAPDVFQGAVSRLGDDAVRTHFARPEKPARRRALVAETRPAPRSRPLDPDLPGGHALPGRRDRPLQARPVSLRDPESGADPPAAVRRHARNHAQGHGGPEARRGASGDRRPDRNQGDEGRPTPRSWRARSTRGRVRPANPTRVQRKSGRPREPSLRRVPCRRGLRAATGRPGRARRSRSRCCVRPCAAHLRTRPAWARSGSG